MTSLDLLHPVFFAAMLIAAFWMGYLLGCGVRLALRAARHDFFAEEDRHARAASAAPWAREIVERLAREAGIQ